MEIKHVTIKSLKSKALCPNTQGETMMMWWKLNTTGEQIVRMKKFAEAWSHAKQFFYIATILYWKLKEWEFVTDHTQRRHQVESLEPSWQLGVHKTAQVTYSKYQQMLRRDPWIQYKKAYQNSKGFWGCSCTTSICFIYISNPTAITNIHHDIFV